MGLFSRILLSSPRLSITAFLLVIGGVSGALKHRDNQKKVSSQWGQDESARTYSATVQEVGGWGKGTRSAAKPAPPVARETNEKLWKDDDGVIYEEEDVKAFGPSEFE